MERVSNDTRISGCVISTVKVYFLLVLLVTSSAFAELVITIGGDLNFSRDEQKVNSQGVFIPSQQKTVEWSQLTEKIQPLLDGDLNFANLETVVSDDDTLVAENKAFQFMTHPQAVQHLINIGFNLFSLSNNHSYDYGLKGIEHTIEQTEQLEKKNRNTLFFGLERNRQDFAKAKVIQVQGYRIAVAAIGIMDAQFRPSNHRAGQLSYRSEQDWKLVIQSLNEADADFRILSVHSGVEMKVTPEIDQQTRFRSILDSTQVDMIIGHHPHVVRPIEARNGKLIFYSLGNYLMIGAANTSGLEMIKNWGMFAKIYISSSTNGQAKVKALQVIPLTQVHLKSRPLYGLESKQRIQALNQIGDGSVVLKVADDGTGYLCSKSDLGRRATRMCQQNQAAN